MLPVVLPVLLTLAPTPAEVVHAWDDRRAAAWAAGDVAGLRALYTDGSVAGRRDAAMLRAWTARGLRVSGLRTQLLRVEVRARAPGRLVLEVTDRVAGGVAVPGRVTLPWDRPTAHVLVFRRVGDRWRVSSARPG